MENDPTKQLLISISSNEYSLLFLQSLISKINNILLCFPIKQLNLQLLSIFNDKEDNNKINILLTFNKIKSSILFYDKAKEYNFPYNINFTKELFGSYDKRKIKEIGKDLFISKCFSSSIKGNESTALYEITSIINNLLKENNFKQIQVSSISLSLSYVYLTFSSTDSLKYILDIISNPNWKSPSSENYIYSNNIHWDVQLANISFVKSFFETQDARQIYYSINNYKYIPGLIFQEDFISNIEENNILNWINRPNPSGNDNTYWEYHIQGKKNLMKRRVQHYGYKFNYKTLLPDIKVDNIPDIFLPIINRLIDNKLISNIPNQLTINEYDIGQGILSHIDTHSAFDDNIVSISLNSDCGMEFIHIDNLKKKIGIYLPRLSVLVLQGESRYAWKHGITKKLTDNIITNNISNSNNLMDIFYPSYTVNKRKKRISLTFRYVKEKKECFCKWPSVCDYQQNNIKKQSSAHTIDPSIQKLLQENTKQTEELGKQLEREHVIDFYETAAVHFSHTRHSPWPLISRFLTNRSQNNNIEDLEDYNGITDGIFIADVGCGNGKYLRCIPSSVIAIGTDISSNLLQQSKLLGTHNHDLFVADGLSLPFRDELFDITLCIAVFHHISTKLRRLQLAKELLRILKPQGRLLVYAWAFEQKQDEVGSRKFPTQDCFVPWHLSKKLTGTNNEQILQRFCHVYKEGELEDIFNQVGNIKVLHSYNDHSNWAVIIQKQ